MQHLWAPWRMEYIGGEKPSGCIFCDRLAANDDRASLIVARRARAFAILNRFPYNNGHLMVVPYSHVPSPEDLDDGERLALMDLLSESLGVLRGAMSPEGCNLGMTLGQPAGAGI